MSQTVPLAIAGCILLVIGMLSVIGLQFNAPELNPWRDTISQHVHTRNGILYRVQSYATGLGVLSLLFACPRSENPTYWSCFAWLLRSHTHRGGILYC